MQHSPATTTHHHRISSFLYDRLEQTDDAGPTDDPHTRALCARFSYEIVHAHIPPK